MPRPEDNTPLGESIGEIVDRTTKIVHEEIELAKAEMSVALQDLLRGSVAGIVGGVFAFFGLFILLIAFSFLVADAVGAWYPWLGFFIVAFICFLLGGLLAFVALKKIKKGSQLAPTQAIDEAKQTKEALQAEADKEIETIDSTAVEEPSFAKPPAATTEPAKSPEVAEAEAVAEGAKEELKEAREDADELQLDAKEAKRRAKQEAKEAKEAAKAAKKAEQEAAKAEAIAAKQAEKAQKEAEKARAKAEKEAEKNAKKAAKAAGKEPEPEPEPEQPAAGEPQRYVAPKPPTQTSPPQTPPAPPTSGGPTEPPTPPAPPTDPTENN